MTDSLSKTVHAFTSCVLMSVSVDETLLPWLVNLSTSFRELPFSVEYIYIYIYIGSRFCISHDLLKMTHKSLMFSFFFSFFFFGEWGVVTVVMES